MKTSISDQSHTHNYLKYGAIHTMHVFMQICTLHMNMDVSAVIEVTENIAAIYKCMDVLISV